MKYLKSFLFGLLILSTNPPIYAQDSLIHKTIFPEGITLEYGIGNYAVTDEYISKEKYSGTLPYYKFGWTNQHEDYVYQLGIEYRYSSDVKNYNISTNIYQFSLNQGFLYSLPEFSLFNNDVYTFLGPSTELFIYHNEQNIAVSGFDYAQSFAALISLGINSELFYPVWNNFNVESSLAFTVLSLGFRMVDEEETDVSPVKPLTLFSGLNAQFSVGARYYLFNNLSLKVAYLINVTRISSWDPLLSASDNLIFTLTYGI
jgi:hypothetical protein